MALSGTIKKRLLPFLLSGTILAGAFSCAPAKTSPQKNKETTTEVLSDSIKKIQEETRHQLKISNNRYTLKQAFVRAVAGYNGDFSYPARNNVLTWVFYFSAQADYKASQVPKDAKPIWEELQTLKNSPTIIGPALTSFSASANIFYTYSSMSDCVGFWSAGDGIIRITNDTAYADPDYLLRVETHETLHGLQTANHTDAQDMSWSIRDLQASWLSNEASAAVVEYLFALEMRKNDLPGTWNTVVEEDSLKSTQILAVYNEALANNTPYAKALAATGKAEFYAQFQDQYWLDFYNEDVLTRYINLMTSARLTPPCGKSYGLETARKTGYVSADFNFTAGLDSLPSSQMFGSNKRMKQAFDYADLEHLAATLGRHDQGYLEKLTQLEKDKNPYLGVDFHLVQEMLKDPANKGCDMLKAMNRAAGLTPCKDAHGRKFHAYAHKIKMRAP
jgi:hypothetical protein